MRLSNVRGRKLLQSTLRLHPHNLNINFNNLTWHESMYMILIHRQSFSSIICLIMSQGQKKPTYNMVWKIEKKNFTTMCRMVAKSVKYLIDCKLYSFMYHLWLYLFFVEDDWVFLCKVNVILKILMNLLEISYTPLPGYSSYDGTN